MSLELEAIRRRPRPIGYTMPANIYGTAADMISEVKRINQTMRPSEKVRVRLPAPPEVVLPLAKTEAVARRRRDYLFLASTAYKLSGPRWNHISADFLIAEVCDKHTVSINQIKGYGRSPDVVAARFEAYARLSEELGYSLPMIGRAMGGKEHTGVLNGIRKHKERANAAYQVLGADGL